MKLELSVTRREKSMFSRVKSMMEELRDTCQSREIAYLKKVVTELMLDEREICLNKVVRRPS